MAKPDPFMDFVAERRSDLRRIASRTQGEHGIDDVVAEAWLLADRIGRRRGLAIEFRQPADQDLVLAWLHNELVKFADKSLRYAVRLDRGWDEEDGDAAVHAMARLLAAPEHFDPAVQMQREQDAGDPLDWTRHSYSQASAYLILLARFGRDTEALAEHLRIVRDTLLARLRWFAAWTQRQPSLFDGLQVMARDFTPSRAVVRGARPEMPISRGEQLSWDFPPR